MSGHQSFAKLREILAYLYPEEIDARRVAQDADLDVSYISFSEKSIDNWNAVVLQAQKEGKTASLMAVTFREYKENEKLSKAWYDYLVISEKKEANTPFDSSSNRKTLLPFKKLSIAAVVLIIIGISAGILLLFVTEPTPEQEVLSVISTEVRGAINQDLPLLKSVYASYAAIIDQRQTRDPTDDLRWEGWSQIEQRFEEYFFPLHLRSFSLDGLSITTITLDSATVTYKGVIANGEYWRDTGAFTLEKQDGKWVITKLVYGVPN